jgi:beta-lactamase class D
MAETWTIPLDPERARTRGALPVPPAWRGRKARLIPVLLVAVTVLALATDPPAAAQPAEDGPDPRARAGTPAVGDTVLDLSVFFDGLDGCFVLLDVGDGRAARHDPERCRRRFSPCSTFKIPNSLIGLETGVVTDADFVIPWDGVERSRASVNRDHTLRSALRYSVVWYYQELARRVGEERMQAWVDSLQYGNRDLSGGPTTFWLTSSLAISADEQADFLARLQRGELPCSRRSVEIVKDIMLAEQGEGWTYRGKTGSGPGATEDLGWWVGLVERDGRAWAFACNVSGSDLGYGGLHARRVGEAILRHLGLLPEESAAGPGD